LKKKERWFEKKRIFRKMVWKKKENRERLGLKRKKEVSEEEEGEVHLTGAVHGENDSTCA